MVHYVLEQTGESHLVKTEHAANKLELMRWAIFSAVLAIALGYIAWGPPSNQTPTTPDGYVPVLTRYPLLAPIGLVAMAAFAVAMLRQLVMGRAYVVSDSGISIPAGLFFRSVELEWPDVTSVARKKHALREDLVLVTDRRRVAINLRLLADREAFYGDVKNRWKSATSGREHGR
jgi:hypothetical protein